MYAEQVMFFMKMYKGNPGKMAEALTQLKAAMKKAKADKLKGGIAPSPHRLRTEAYDLQRYLSEALQKYVPHYREHWDTANASVQFERKDDTLTFTITMKGLNDTASVPGQADKFIAKSGKAARL